MSKKSGADPSRPFWLFVMILIFFAMVASLPNTDPPSEQARRAKALQDCDTLVQAVNKYNDLEDRPLTSLDDLRLKYVTNINTMKDPWGRAYDIDLPTGIVFSKGPDGFSTLGRNRNSDEEGDDLDNIAMSIGGTLCLMAASLETSAEVEALHLYFNSPVSVERAINFRSFTTSEVRTPESEAVVREAIFRYYETDGGGRNFTLVDPVKSIAGFEKLPWNISPAPLDPSIKKGEAYERSVRAGSYRYGEDSREIVVSFPDDCRGVLVPERHAINLTGSGLVRNRVFSDLSPCIRTRGAVAAKAPVVIQKY